LVRGDTNRTGDVFLRDRARATTTRISVSSTGVQANGSSDLTTLSISYDGRYIAFDSQATNLVLGDTNGKEDVFVRDQATHTTGRVSVSSTGTQTRYFSEGEAIAANAGYVVFTSFAGNLVPNDTNHVTDVFIHHPLP
jgi:Tol biopolymer transport system component